MKHEEYKKLMLTKKVRENEKYNYQCVALVKDYYLKVYGIKLPSFHGSAYNGYYTWFKGFDTIKNTPTGVPPQGAMIFFTIPQTVRGRYRDYGHVGIVDYATNQTVKILEQNAGDGNGDGLGDNAIRLKDYNYMKPKVLGWKVLESN